MAVYKRDIVDINLETGNIHRSFLKHSIGYMDQKADHFGIRAYRDGVPVDLTGVSVQGVFMPPQGSPIAITTGNIVSDNVAEVVLPQACYNYDGQFTLAIKLVDSTNEVTGTVRIVDGMVDNTHASGTVAPTSAVPTYQEVLSAYEQAIAVIGASVRFDQTQSLTDAQKATARSNIGAPSTADMNTALALKVNVSDIENDLTGTTAGKVLDARQGKVLDDKVSDLKSAFGHKIGYLIKNQTAENGTDKNLFNIDDAVVGYDIDVNGVLSTNVNRNVSTYIPVNPRDTIYFYYLKTSVTPATSPALKVTGVAAFDINGNVVASAGTHPASSSDRPTSYTVPTGIHYIRVSYINTNTGIMFVPNNSSLSVSETIAYTTPGYIDNYSVRFTDTQSMTETQKRTARNNIGAMGGDVIRYLHVVDDSNMFDISAALLTSDINVNGVISYNVNRTVSDYIPVNPGDIMYFYKKNTGQTVTSELVPKNVAAYDQYKTVMPSAGQSSFEHGNYTVPSGVKFIRFSYVNINTNVMCLQNNGSFPSSSDPESYKAPGYIYEGEWSNIKWMVIGDSLTDHTNAYATKRYYDYVKDDTGIQLVKKGKSGDGYARDHWFYDALDSVTASDFDICTFFGSGNDLNIEAIWGAGATWEDHFGTVTDNGETTVLGWINKTIDHFITLYPLKKLGIVTPTPWALYSDPSTGTINGSHMDEYASALVTICKNRGIPCLDLYHESGLRPWLESFRTEYYNESSPDHSDGVHPNTKGHKWIYPMFMQFLKQYLVD